VDQEIGHGRTHHLDAASERSTRAHP
jgi:hypothetical protein